MTVLIWTARPVGDGLAMVGSLVVRAGVIVNGGAWDAALACCSVTVEPTAGTDPDPDDSLDDGGLAPLRPGLRAGWLKIELIRSIGRSSRGTLR